MPFWRFSLIFHGALEGCVQLGSQIEWDRQVVAVFLHTPRLLMWLEQRIFLHHDIGVLESFGTVVMPNDEIETLCTLLYPGKFPVHRG